MIIGSILAQLETLSTTKGKDEIASYEHACNFNLVQRNPHSRTIPEHLQAHFQLLHTMVNTSTASSILFTE